MKEFLKNKRIAAGLSQREVADRFGYKTAQFVSNWECGISRPPVRQLKQLARLYKVPQDELFDIFLQHEIEQLSEDLRKKFEALNWDGKFR